MFIGGRAVGALADGCGLGGWVGKADGFAVGEGVVGGLGVGRTVGVAVGVAVLSSADGALVGDRTEADISEVDEAFVMVEGEEESVAVDGASVGLIDGESVSSRASAVGVGFDEGVMGLELIDGAGVSSAASAVGVGFDEGEAVDVGTVVGLADAGVLGLMVDDSGASVLLL